MASKESTSEPPAYGVSHHSLNMHILTLPSIQMKATPTTAGKAMLTHYYMTHQEGSMPKILSIKQ